MITQEDIDAMQTPKVHPYEALAEFIQSFGGSLDPRLWIKLNEEELDELYKEVPNTPEHLKEYADLMYVHIGLDLTSGDNLGALLPDDERAKVTKVLQRVDRALKEYYEYYGDAIVSEAFRRVHESNMSKLDANGKPIRREDGKIMKGPNYKAPDLTDLIETKKKAKG